MKPGVHGSGSPAGEIDGVAARAGRNFSTSARKTVAIAAIAAYPFLLVAGLDHVAARTIGAAALAFAVAALAVSRTSEGAVLPLVVRRFGIVAAVALVATATNNAAILEMLPTLTSLWLLVAFALTLRRGPSMVEQFARSMHDEFPEFLVPYCRSVTVVWCMFFAVNATTSAVLALAATPRTWALYTGFFSYLLIAALAAGEYVVHKSRFRFYEDGPVDDLWRRLCPPERTELGRRTLEWQRERNAEAGSAIGECAPPEPAR